MLVTPSVFVMLRSAVGVMTVLLSVALLFPAGSLVPAGAVTVAVFVIVPEPAVTVAVAVNVPVPPLRRLTKALRLPLPLAGQLEPAECGRGRDAERHREDVAHRRAHDRTRPRVTGDDRVRQGRT